MRPFRIHKGGMQLAQLIKIFHFITRNLRLKPISLSITKTVLCVCACRRGLSMGSTHGMSSQVAKIRVSHMLLARLPPGCPPRLGSHRPPTGQGRVVKVFSSGRGWEREVNTCVEGVFGWSQRKSDWIWRRDCWLPAPRHNGIPTGARRNVNYLNRQSSIVLLTPRF